MSAGKDKAVVIIATTINEFKQILKNHECVEVGEHFDNYIKLKEFIEYCVVKVNSCNVVSKYDKLGKQQLGWKALNKAFNENIIILTGHSSSIFNLEYENAGENDIYERFNTAGYIDKIIELFEKYTR